MTRLPSERKHTAADLYICGVVCGTQELKNGFACVSDVSGVLSICCVLSHGFAERFVPAICGFLSVFFAGVILSLLK